MTPEEQALELVEKHHSEMELTATSFAKAQDHALITVGKILQFTIHPKSDLYYNFEKYWQEVKEEINKL